jgi:hypothetical protein
MTTPETPLRVVEKSDTLAEAAAPPPPAAAAPAAPPGRQPVTLRLTVPIQAHGETLTSLTIHPLKVEDIEAHDAAVSEGTGKMRAVSDSLMRLARIPRSSVLQMDAADYMAACRVVADFFDRLVPKS